MLPENTGSHQAFVTPTQQVLEAFANRLPFLWTVLRHLHSQQLHLIPIFIFLPWTALYLLQGKLICLRRWLSYQLWVIKNMFLQTLCLVQILFDCTRVQTWQIWPIPCRDQVIVTVSLFGHKMKTDIRYNTHAMRNKYTSIPHLQNGKCLWARWWNWSYEDWP